MSSNYSLVEQTYLLKAHLEGLVALIGTASHYFCTQLVKVGLKHAKTLVNVDRNNNCCYFYKV